MMTDLATAQAKHDKIISDALDDYDKIVAAAWAKRDKIIGDARADYDKFDKIVGDARADYDKFDKIVGDARADYDKIVAATWAKYRMIASLADVAARAEFSKILDGLV